MTCLIHLFWYVRHNVDFLPTFAFPVLTSAESTDSNYDNSGIRSADAHSFQRVKFGRRRQRTLTLLSEVRGIKSDFGRFRIANFPAH